jgi:hypothetical protein
MHLIINLLLSSPSIYCLCPSDLTKIKAEECDNNYPQYNKAIYLKLGGREFS